ncbi:DHA2 family efflux MFS transporter permease subunit [Anaerosinus massiliensis]|uniref:DHA2 family efflux MFS transporter permease subunit n=1 Tax=Massilibacillus massiliensis TaxID=1806837 RepID=UPI003898F984
MHASECKETHEFKVLPIMTALLISGFIGMFSETALNIAINDLMHLFDITPATIQWLTTIYLLTLGILVPVSGFLIKWFTTRQLFITSLCFSILGFFMAALAPSFSILLISRILQAIGSGLLLPLIFNTVLIIFPPQKRGTAMGIVGLVILSAPAIGPTLAGLLTEHLSWHWIFWCSLPLLLVSLLFGIKYMQNLSTITRPPIDLLSIGLSTLGFGSIVFGFSNAGDVRGLNTPEVYISLGLGTISLVMFTVRQLSLDQPILNLRAFMYPMFSLGVFLVMIVMMIILASVIILPIYLQGGLGISMSLAGLIMLPGGLINGIMSQVSGRLFDRTGPKLLVLIGFFITTLVMWLFSTLTQSSTIFLVILLHSGLMLGTAMIMTSVQTNALNQLPRPLYPDGTAIMTTLQQIAGAIGTALAMCFLSVGQKNYLATAANVSDPVIIAKSLIAGSQTAFLFVLAITIIGVLFALLLKRVKL